MKNKNAFNLIDTTYQNLRHVLEEARGERITLQGAGR